VHTSICLSLDFFERVFTKRHWRYKYVESVSPKIFSMSCTSFSQHNRMTFFIFSLNFWRIIHDNWALTVQEGVLTINYRYYWLQWWTVKPKGLRAQADQRWTVHVFKPRCNSSSPPEGVTGIKPLCSLIHTRVNV
jgi:hypothetical protein